MNYVIVERVKILCKQNVVMSKFENPRPLRKQQNIFYVVDCSYRMKSFFRYKNYHTSFRDTKTYSCSDN